MAVQKTDFTATGQSATFTVSNSDSRYDERAVDGIVYHADFATGVGVGTVRLEVLVDAVWVPVAAALSTDTPLAVFFQVNRTTDPVQFRWNCTAYTSGTISCYIM